jgi:hypothetical protein
MELLCFSIFGEALQMNVDKIQNVFDLEKPVKMNYKHIMQPNQNKKQKSGDISK